MIDFIRSDSAAGAARPAASDEELARLGEEIARLSAHIQAATCRLLDLIRAFDESEGWHKEGFRTCGAWLSWRTGIAPGPAREKVRVARALGELPALRAALERGALSYSVARAISRVATPATDTDWVALARDATAVQMERLVRRWRVANRSQESEREQRRHEERALSVVPEADGSWRIQGRLDPEVGAVLCRALEAAGEALRNRDANLDAQRDASAEIPAEARRADALGLLAEAALGKGLGAESESAVVGRAERFQVVVHVPAGTLAGAGAELHAEAPRIEGGPYVPAETVRRLACDSGVVKMFHGRDGSVLDAGRRRRTVSTALRRVLAERDRGCRFPGCGARFCDAHHVRHWADGGETTPANLLLLCRHHHRRVHEEGWTVTPDKAGGTLFTRPDGRVLPNVPESPVVPADPVGDLEQRHENLDIDPWTATPQWNGDRLDLDWTLSVLGQRWMTELIPGHDLP